MVDLCDFAQVGMSLILRTHGRNLVVPFEQCPHFTIEWGFIGDQLFVCMLIKIGKEGEAPHAHHCQLLKDSQTLVLAQTTNGWTNSRLVTDLLQLQYDSPLINLGRTLDSTAAAETAAAAAAAATAATAAATDHPADADAGAAAPTAAAPAPAELERRANGAGGSATDSMQSLIDSFIPYTSPLFKPPPPPEHFKGSNHEWNAIPPKVLNFDGHVSHVYNESLKDGFAANKVLALSPCSHTSAPSQKLPGTQQADYGSKDGGGIACFKAKFRPKMRKQFRAALERPTGDPLKGRVTISQLLKMAEDSLIESWDGSMGPHLNSLVGYYIDADGFLKYDILRRHRDQSKLPGAAARKTTKEDILLEKRRAVDKKIYQAAMEIDAVNKAVGKVTAPVVAAPTLPIARKCKAAPNALGMVVSRDDSDQLTETTARAATDKAANEKDKEKDKENAMWEKNRPAVRSVEERYAALGTPTGLKVPEKRMLILSRTGQQAIAKNNKPEEGKEDEETPLMKETRAVLRKHAQSRIPRTPPRPGPQPGAAATVAVAPQEDGAGAEDEGEDGEEDEADAMEDAMEE